MKTYITAVSLLLLGLSARAQKAADFRQFHDVFFSLLPSPAPASLYARLADTLNPKPAVRLSRDRVASVVGQYSSHWAVVQHNGFNYFLRQGELAGLRPGQNVTQAVARMQAPLPLNEQHLVDYAQVVEVPGASQNELYARGKVWFANNFQSALKATQADDKQAGILIGRGGRSSYVALPGGSSYSAWVWYTVKLSFKDGRYRYSLTDFSLSDYGGVSSGGATYPAESLIFATRANGIPTNEARVLTRILGQEVYHLSTAIELGMSRPAAGADF